MAPTASPAPSKDRVSRRPEDEDVKPYVISHEIGKGSFATVYKGYHQVRSHFLEIIDVFY